MTRARRPWRAVRQLRSDRCGTAAVEVALLSPLLVLLFLATIEVTQLVRVEAKLARGAETIQNIVAGAATLTTGSLQIAFSGGQIVMTPFSAQNMSAAIASVSFDSSGKPQQVAWQQLENGSAGMTVPFACSSATGMSLGNDTVIVVTASYTYYPIVSYLFGKKYTLTQVAYGRPRGSSSTPTGTNGAVGGC